MRLEFQEMDYGQYTESVETGNSINRDKVTLSYMKKLILMQTGIANQKFYNCRGGVADK